MKLPQFWIVASNSIKFASNFCHFGNLQVPISSFWNSASPPLIAASELCRNSSPGRRRFRGRVSRAGEPIHATLAGGAEIQGKQFACASCHRPSGFGSSEGLVTSPPVTARALFKPVVDTRDRGDDFRELFQELGGDRTHLRDIAPALGLHAYKNNKQK
jgi:hypothetical protein